MDWRPKPKSKHYKTSKRKQNYYHILYMYIILKFSGYFYIIWFLKHHISLRGKQKAVIPLTLMGKPEPRGLKGHDQMVIVESVISLEHTNLGLNSNYVTYLAIWPWVHYIISLHFGFLTCKMERITFNFMGSPFHLFNRFTESPLCAKQQLF